MNKKFCNFGLFLVFFLAFCSEKNKRISHAESFMKLISENREINSHLKEAFGIEDTSNTKILKVLISRRYSDVRITVSQIFQPEDLNDLPSDFFFYQRGLFLLYDGSEVIFNERMTKENLNSVVLQAKVKLDSSQYMIYDSRVVQFDINSDKKVKFNFPPINPYDLREVPANPKWKLNK